MTKAQYQKLIAAYKLQNPVKYESKKAEFAKKLAALGGEMEDDGEEEDKKEDKKEDK